MRGVRGLAELQRLQRSPRSEPKSGVRQSRARRKSAVLASFGRFLLLSPRLAFHDAPPEWVRRFRDLRTSVIPRKTTPYVRAQTPSRSGAAAHGDLHAPRDRGAAAGGSPEAALHTHRQPVPAIRRSASHAAAAISTHPATRRTRQPAAAQREVQAERARQRNSKR